MKMKSKAIVCVAAAIMAVASTGLAADAVQFTKKPAVEKAGAGLRIDFAVSAATDVAVYIEDSSCKVLCHMVAGMLGATPPPPLKANSLEQSITWDGKDDAGKPVADLAGLRVRVTLGTRGQFDRFLLDNPDGVGRVSAIAVGPAGSLYVFHVENTANDNQGGHKVKVFSRDGKRLKTLVPFPADIDPAKVQSLGIIRDKDGSIIPRVHNWQTLSFYPDNGYRGRDMPDAASIPAVDSKGRVYWMVRGPSICAVDADGGIPNNLFLGPKLLKDRKGVALAGELYQYWPEKPALAVSSDDKFVYFAGLSDAAGPLPCVFRVPADARGPEEVFAGKLDEKGGEKGLLTAPRGLAVAKGLVYVADPPANRIAVFKESDGSFAGEIRVAHPQCIGVDPTSGAVYVCCYTSGKASDKPNGELVKISGLDQPRELYRIVLPKQTMSPDPGQRRIAVDASVKDRVRIWMPEVTYAPWSLKCFEDDGQKFVDIGDPRPQKPWAEGPRDLIIDRDRGELYVKSNYGKMNGQKWWRLNEQTCELEKAYEGVLGSTASGAQIVPGPDGALYAMCFGPGLLRLDREFKPLPFPGQKSNAIAIGGTMNFQQRYLAFRPFAPADEIFVVPPPFYRYVLEQKMTWDDAAKKAREVLPARITSLNAIGLDGKTRRTVIWQCLDSAVVRLDRWGNVYLADGIKPVDRDLPEFFDDKAEAIRNVPKSSSYWLSATYGSIVKFPPTGGAIWFAKDKLPPSCIDKPPADLLAKPKVPFKTLYDSGYNVGAKDGVQGAEWIRFGYSPYSLPGSGGMCNCEGNGFDVDPFGRVFYPNLGQSRVEIIDTNNNSITTFGRYGNEDSGGANAIVRKPDIPLAWPVYVAASDTHVYVADTVNRRIVRVKLTFAADETVAVK